MRVGGENCRGLDFEFGDCDSLLVELEEQYSYAESNDLKLNRNAAEQLATEIGDEIGSESFCRRALAHLEINNNQTRLTAIRSLLCVLQGGSHVELRSQNINAPTPLPSQEEQEILNAELIHGIREGCYQLAKLEAWSSCINLLVFESRQALNMKRNEENHNEDTLLAQKYLQIQLRLMYSICYTLLEIIRRPPAPSDPTDWYKIHIQFKDDLCDHTEQIIDLMDLMVEATQQMGQPILPLKKLSLLVWKLTLAIFGGFQEAHDLKNKKRLEEGLDLLESPMDVIRQLTPVTTQVDVMIMGENYGQDNQVGSELGGDRRANQRPRLFRDSQKDDEEFEDDTIEDEIEIEEEAIRPSTPAPNSMGRGTPRPSLTSSRPSSPNGQLTPCGLVNWTFPHLPWRPKVTHQEMNEYISSARVKFLDYSLFYGQSEQELNLINQNRFGLPKPIQQSLDVMDKYIYVPLSQRQRNKWRETEDHPLTRAYSPEQCPIETLYSLMWNKVPVYMISLLKLLLAAAPTANKGEILQHDQAQQSMQIENDPKAFKLPAMLIGVDVARHKEIATKALSGFLLLLLKHFKANHIHQFEYVTHHLYISNCVPLIVKIFNQSMPMFVTQRNQIPFLDFRNAVRGLPIIQASIERAEEEQMPVCWRNMYSSICFLRILVKLMKDKPWRAIWLVKYKATNIFKKAMLVKHGMFQLYLLKVIKLHARFLGRPWRKTNMDIVSAIYSTLRHHLTDDWAFANETEKLSRPWEYRGCEADITTTCSSFNRLLYSNEDDEWTALADRVDEEEIKLPNQFDRKYEAWLDREVLAISVDWNQLIMPVQDKLMESC